jgi:hypothetical protein
MIDKIANIAACIYLAALTCVMLPAVLYLMLVSYMFGSPATEFMRGAVDGADEHLHAEKHFGFYCLLSWFVVAIAAGRVIWWLWSGA